MNYTALEKLSLSWCLKVTWLAVFKLQAWEFGPIYTPTNGFGILLAEGKPTLNYEGKDFVLENPIKADFALIKAHQGDRWGNLVY